MAAKIVKEPNDEMYSEKYLKFAQWMKRNGVKPLTRNQYMFAEYVLHAIGDYRSVHDNVEAFKREELKRQPHEKI